MEFQINTPQSMGAYIAMQESRKASRCKSAYGSDMSSAQNSHLLSGSALRDDASVSSSPHPAVRPARNKGGRPRTRMLNRPKKFKGPARFQKNHPIKAAVNIDVWENILLFCPPDFLLKARMVSSTFRSVLKDDSPIWRIARINYFGSDMPEPPSGLSEPQYADLLTGTGCQTRGCQSKKTRKTYWAVQKRLCGECFHKAVLPPRALRTVFKEFETSRTPQYRFIEAYCQSMEEYLPGMKFDRWDNYQWLGDYDPNPSWGQVYRSGQYVAFPAAAYTKFSLELASLVGNEYNVEHSHFTSKEPLPGKACPPQTEIDDWFEAKRAVNNALVPELQAVENWFECYKRNKTQMGKNLRKDRESFFEEQAKLAGLNIEVLGHFEAYRASIAISKPPTAQSWKILLPKLMAQCERAKRSLAEQQAGSKNEAEGELERGLEEMRRELVDGEGNETGNLIS